MHKIIIRHLSGSKAGQIEELAPAPGSPIVIGRSDAATVRYDPQRDDLVSREHCRLEPIEGETGGYRIVDLNSRNGTYLNRQRLTGSAVLTPGDVIQLGPGGPEFEFGLDPPPPAKPRPTREIGPAAMPATRETDTVPPVTVVPPDAGAAKAAIGRATVERMIGESQRSAHRMHWNVAVLLIGVVVLVAAVMLYLNWGSRQELASTRQTLDEQIKITRDMVSQKPAAASDPRLSPADVTGKFGPTTVFIEVAWKLIHTASDRQVYHRIIDRLPAYLQRPDGRIVPWLTLDSERGTNLPIADQHTGSGFVVTSNGFILTNRHVAATWRTGWTLPDKGGRIFELVQRRDGQLEVGPRAVDAPLGQFIGRVHPWVPGNEVLLVEPDKRGRFLVQGGSRLYEGRFDALNVTFPKTKLRIPARLVRVSDQHDVALLKIDVPGSVPKVDLYDSYASTKAGDAITVLGYPGVSPDVGVRTKSQDPLNPRDEWVQVPDLTVTDGLIGKVIRGQATPAGGQAYDYASEAGDVFQLTVNATGGGNSGGPVFDERGRVIGIFTFGLKTDVQISFAVPIRFGLDLMEIKPVLE